MPRYVYKCPDGHENEREYGFSETKPASITCHCKKKAARTLGKMTTIFKGPGFTKSLE